MTRATAWLPAGLLAALAAGLLLTPTTRAGDIGYVEDFALAKDRSAALKQLIPGTEDYYYYHALHALNTGQVEKLDALLRPWHERHGQTGRLTEIQVRHALLGYEKNPKQSVDFLVRHLGLQFAHQKETLGVAPNLPTALDPKLIDRAALRANTFARWGNLDNFEDSALDWLAAGELTWERRRHLLQRLQRPDVPTLPKLIHDDLTAEHAQPFGSFPVHFMLTVPQLEELLKLRPGLINDGNFVRAWVSKLHPGADADWRRDKAVARAYLDRLQAVTDTLPPVHNALKAHVLFHRLALDRSEDVYDKDRFLAYLQLPRFQPYMAKAWNDRRASQEFPAHLNVDFTAHTLLPAPTTDEELVRSYLKHFLADAPGTAEFEPYIDPTWLTRLFAETKVEDGVGDPEAWASKLPPDLFAKLKDRIDIDFAYTNKTDFAADEPVKLDLFVKNVPNLLVKVFEVNAANFYRAQLREVDTDINLDGLVANTERAHPYADPPTRRMARTFEFPQLTKPGVYVIDFIGSGKSSRALVRKGRLRPVVATGTAGQTVTVVDETDKPVADAVVWLAGVEYRCDKNGKAILPFTAQPGRRPVVLSRGEFSCLDTVEHQPENYQLTAGIHVDRESLLAQRPTSLVVRPALALNGLPVSVKLLEEVRLRITSVDHSGIASSTEVPEFKLFEDREAVQDFRVPGRLHRLTVSLSAKVKSLGTGKPIDLAVHETFALNEIDHTDKIEDLHLAKFGPNFVLELLGRTGEFKPDRPVQVAFKHRDFKEVIGATLKTDAAGRVVLGPLADVVVVSAVSPEGTQYTWPLPLDRHTYRGTLHAKAGDTVTVPYLGAADKPTRGEFALLEVRGTVIAADKFDALAIKDGLLEARGLAPGDYDLWVKQTGQKVRIRVTDGPAVAGYLLGKLRQLQVPGLKPVQIAAVTADADVVLVQLKDANKFARVHLFASRYLPAYSAFDNLGKVRDADLGGVVPTRPESVYLTGRNIGDEYRYVLDRRGMRKFPGNMLDRPQLLLNPWAIRSTETGEQLAQGGEMFKPRGEPPASSAFGTTPAKPHPGSTAGADFANLDFLADPSAVLLNLEPNKDGLVRVDRKKIGPHPVLQVVAVDPLTTTVRTVSLAEQPAGFVDLRLRDGLDPAGHFTQQKQVSVLTPGRPFVLNDVVGSRFEAYDSLAKVYGLYATLSKDPKLAEFSFVLTWPKLKDAEKRELYSKFACHELSFFLWKKDPAFFAAVVKPYLANKKDKTFLDHWLLGDDVSAYTDPWRHGRLNTVERVLLSRRLAGEGDRTARHLDDLFRLLPPNIGRELVLFDTAVQTSELAPEGTDFAKMKDNLHSRQALGQLGAGDAGPDLAAKMPGGGPGGGRMPGAPPASQPAPAAVKPQEEMKKQAKESGARSGRSERGDKDGKRLEDAQAGIELYYENDREKAVVRQLYRKLDPTMEWAENNYYKLRITEQTAGLIGVDPFWVDYARYAGNGPFLSRHLADASRNFTEMMFALAALDLPFEPAKHVVAFDGGKMTLGPAGPVVAFHEEVRRTDGPDGKVPVLVGQNFYRPADRFREENGEKVDKYVSGEFIVHTVYGCQVVVTNPTSTRQRLSVLVQLPVGAIPVGNGQYTRTVHVDLEPYRTQTVDYLFYFPKPGRFAHFPAHVAKSERVVAAAQPTQFEVLEKPSRPDTTSWDYISQHGTDDEVFAYMNRENVNALNLDKIAFRMRDRAVYERVIVLLRGRHVFHPTLWSYGLFHNDPGVVREYLPHNDGLVGQCGGPIDTPLLTIDSVERHAYEHLEYKPLVNARAHSLGSRRQIVNGPLHDQYHRLLKQLSYRTQLDDTDLLAVVYYLLLQDRIEEAQTAFARVEAERVPTKLQYDYCAAYLAMFDENPVRARSIAAKYLGHPVDRWRNAFAAIVNHLDEATGKGSKVADPTDPGQNQGNLAATEPAFEAGVQGKGVSLSWQNLEAVTLNYIPMDVELLFSRSPFAQQGGGQFAFTRPSYSQVVKLPAGRDKVVIPLPDDLVKRNMLVEVTGAGKARVVTYFASEMDVKITENYGQLKVADAVGGKPLGKVYVKVYAKLADGSVKFHKDGYTDLRGRFDYVSVNTPERQPVQRFSVLVLSEDRGAVIREQGPPQQ
ncbi:MAG: hypothetical protein JWO38_1192 [Gemmataceae bacterium]|nr:hypothetical protein [Gemmataceae bacterium]